MDEENHSRLGELAGTGRLAWTILPVEEGAAKVVAHRSFRNHGGVFVVDALFVSGTCCAGAVRMRSEAGERTCVWQVSGTQDEVVRAIKSELDQMPA